MSLSVHTEHETGIERENNALDTSLQRYLEQTNTVEDFFSPSNEPGDFSEEQGIKIPPPPQSEQFRAARLLREKPSHSTSVDDHVQETRDRDFDGYRKVLLRWPVEARVQLYARVQRGAEIPRPEGFSDAAFKKWQEFVSKKWLSQMSPLDRRALELRSRFVVQLSTEEHILQQEIVQLEGELKKYSGSFARMQRFVSPSRHDDARKVGTRLDYKKRVAEMRALTALRSVDAELDIEKNRLVGMRIDSSERMFTAEVLMQLGGNTNKKTDSTFVIQEQVPWVSLELQRRAVQSYSGFRETGAVRVPSIEELLVRSTRADEHGDKRVVLETYVLELQRAMSILLVDELVAGKTMNEIRASEPFKSFEKTFIQTRTRIEAGEEADALPVYELLNAQIVHADRELSARGLLEIQKNPITRLGSKWIRALFEGADLGDVHHGHTPAAHVEAHSHSFELKHENSYTVHLGDSPRSIMERCMHDFFPHLSNKECGVRAEQFLREGIVHDTGGFFADHFIRDGRFTGTLFVTDVICVTPNPSVPFGFSIEVKRGVGSMADYYFEMNDSGSPEWCYVKGETGAVEVWSFDHQARSHLAGTYTRGKFMPYKERVWDYVALDGTPQQISEFQNGIFFTKSGTILAMSSNVQRSYSAASMNTLGRVSPFPTKVVIRRDEKKVEVDISNGRFLIAPNNTLHVIDPTFGIMPMGTIESEI